MSAFICSPSMCHAVPVIVSGDVPVSGLESRVGVGWESEQYWYLLGPRENQEWLSGSPWLSWKMATTASARARRILTNAGVQLKLRATHSPPFQGQHFCR